MLVKAGLVIAAFVGGALLPSVVSAQVVSIDGSIVLSEPTGSGCEFSPDCFAWTHLSALCDSGVDVRDGLTMSFRRVPSAMLGKRAAFAFEGTRLDDGSKLIVSFRRFTCVDRAAEYDLEGTSEIIVPLQAKYVAVLGVGMANVRWTLVGPINSA